MCHNASGDIIQCPDCTTLNPPLFTLNNTNCSYYPLPAPPLNNNYTALCNLTGLHTEYYLDQFDTVPVCIVMGGVARMIFYPEVDDFSMLDVAARESGPNNEMYRFDSPNMWIQLEVGGVASPPKFRRQDAASGVYVVPYWTAIVILDNGVPQSISWDDGCYGCSGDQCINATCAVSLNDQCWIDGLVCDVKVYVSWFGTDNRGTFLTSSGKRLSRFRSYSISSAFQNAADVAQSQLPARPQFSGIQLGGN